MTREEARTLQQWVVGEWWDEGLEDADVLYDIDPDGFWAVLDEGGQVVGGLSTIAPDEHFGSVSHLYLSADARGRGIWRRALEDLFALLGHRLRDGMTVTIFMMPEAVETTRKFGFEPVHDEIRMVRAPGDVPPAPQDAGVMDARDLLESEVVAFDAARTGRSRPVLWQRWLRMADSATCAVVDDGRIVGLGTMRPSARGHRIGPLFATEPDVAERLLRRLLPAAEGTRIAVDVPASNPAAVALLSALGFVEEFRTVRMAWGKLPAMPWQECYATVMLHLD